MSINPNKGWGSLYTTIRDTINCSGQLVIRIFRNRQEFDRFLVCNHMNSYRADMGASAVPSRLKESSEAT